MEACTSNSLYRLTGETCDFDIVQIEASSVLPSQWEHAHIDLFTGLLEQPVISIYSKFKRDLVYEANGSMQKSVSF